MKGKSAPSSSSSSSPISAANCTLGPFTGDEHPVRLTGTLSFKHVSSSPFSALAPAPPFRSTFGLFPLAPPPPFSSSVSDSTAMTPRPRCSLRRSSSRPPPCDAAAAAAADSVAVVEGLRRTPLAAASCSCSSSERPSFVAVDADCPGGNVDETCCCCCRWVGVELLEIHHSGTRAVRQLIEAISIDSVNRSRGHGS